MATIQEYYEDYWNDPDSYDDPTVPQRQALLRKHLGGLGANAQVADIGCGRGEFCEFFRTQLGYKAIGSDLSNAAIAYARRKYPEVEFHAGPIESLLPTLTGGLDAIFSSEVIEHLFDVGAFLRTTNKLLKPGGRLVITTPYHGLIKNIVVDTLNYSKHYDPLGQHIRFFDRKSLRGCLTATGFEPMVWSGYGRPWPFWKSFFVVSKKVREGTDKDAEMN